MIKLRFKNETGCNVYACLVRGSYGCEKNEKGCCITNRLCEIEISRYIMTAKIIEILMNAIMMDLWAFDEQRLNRMHSKILASDLSSLGAVSGSMAIVIIM